MLNEKFKSLLPLPLNCSFVMKNTNNIGNFYLLHLLTIETVLLRSI